MRTYSEYAPTSFDAHGLALSEQQDWLVLDAVDRNRDSDCLSESNFDAALALLGGENENVEVHRFGHWACGWLEIIIVRPDSEAAAIAQDIEARLADYPVLDEDDMSTREWNAYSETWQQWGWKDFADGLAEKFGVDLEHDAKWDLQDALRDLSAERLQECFEQLIPSGEYYDHDGVPNVRYAVESATREDLDALLQSEPHNTAQGSLPGIE